MRAQPLALLPTLAVGQRTLLTDHLILLLAVTASRWAFRSHALYQMDSINYALGMQHFAPALHQPHPPGYYLYVKLGQLVQQALPNPNDALVAISILASGLTAALIYQLAHAWFGRTAARWAGMLFVFSPMAWFHGTVALVYIVEAAMAALIGYLCWLAWRGRHTMVIPAAAVFGLAAGIRQSTALFLAPLLLISLWRAGGRNALLAIGAGTLAVVAWLLPMLAESGGHAAYFAALNDLWSRVPAAHSATRQPAMIFLHALFLTAAYGLSFATAAPMLFVRSLRASPPPGARLFLTAWLAPGVLFFVFVFFHPFALGYALFLFVPLFALLGGKTAAWFASTGQERAGKILILIACAAFNTALFLWAPVYSSHASVARTEKQLASMQADIRSIAAPSDTVLVSFDWHLYGFRHMGYHLPEYLVLQYPETRITGGFMASAMQGGKTLMMHRLELGQYRRFLIIDAARNVPFREQLVAELPPGTLTSFRIGGHEYLSGPIASLGHLFPVTAGHASPAVRAP